MHVRRLGVLGGTFDPIHIGHLVAAAEVVAALGLDRLLFVPAGRPWQKRDYADAEDRFAMTMLAARSHPAFAVSRIEIDRRGPTYTADTLRSLRDFHGEGTEIFFVAGTDTVQGLATWHRVDEVLSLATIVAVTRPGFAAPGDVRAVEIPGIDVSATAIRERVRTGRPIDFLVPAPVADYIAEHGLYLDAVEEARGA